MAAPTYVAQSNATELTRMTTGQFTTDATTEASITLGYQPRRVELVDETTQALYIWNENNGTTDILKVADAGTLTLDTTQIITSSETGFTFVPEANKTYDWCAFC